MDGHIDTLVAVDRQHRSLATRSDVGHADVPRLVAGGVDVQFFACYIEPQFKPDRGLQRVLQLIDRFYRELGGCPDLAAPAADYDDIVATVAAGKLAAVLSVEGGEAVGYDLANLRLLHRLGVRVLGLTWNQRNAIADGVGETRTGGGLSNFGVEVVREMNRLGMVVDVSHLAEAGFWDVLEVSTKPVLATHSDARALCDHRRNLTDGQIRALAAGGGAMGMNFAPDFLSATGQASVATVLDHIDHIVSLVGPGHVGFGSDFDGIGTPPAGLEDATRLPAITEGLVARGYRDEDILAILGGNFLRVLAAQS